MSRWNIFTWLLVPGTVAVGALTAALCWRNGRRWFAAVGVIGAALGTYVMVSSWSPDSEAFEDLALVALWMFFVVPLVTTPLIGALLGPRAARHPEEPVSTGPPPA